MGCRQLTAQLQLGCTAKVLPDPSPGTVGKELRVKPFGHCDNSMRKRLVSLWDDNFLSAGLVTEHAEFAYGGPSQTPPRSCMCFQSLTWNESSHFKVKIIFREPFLNIIWGLRLTHED